MTVPVPQRLASIPIVGLVPVSMDEANALLVEFGHYLGPCERPFRSEGWALDLLGEPIAVAVTASIVSPGVSVWDRDENGELVVVERFERREVVELARLASRERWATRVMLRLWREATAPRYLPWKPGAAVAYSQNSRHDGTLYRFDGWQKITDRAGSSGGGGWSRKRHASDAVHGAKTLWLWRYEETAA